MNVQHPATERDLPQLSTRLLESVEGCAIFMVDSDGRIITWNGEAERIQGYTANEIFGRHCSLFYTQEAIDRGAPEADLLTAAKEGRHLAEGWCLRKGGSRFWASVITKPIQDQNGTLFGFSKVVRDLTERKRSDEASKLQMGIVQYMPAMASIFSPDGTVDFVNHQWSEYTGLTQEFLRSSPEAWMEAVHSEDRAAASTIFWQGLRSGQAFAMEIRLRRARDGTHRWHLTRGVPLRDESGEVVKFVRTSTDIEELKQAEDAWRKAEERTRLIVESALDAVVAMDADGMIKDWNQQAEQVFGWTRSEALGRRMSETIIPSQYRLSHENGLQRFFNTGQGRVLNRRIEITALRRDGSEFPVELTVTPLKSGDSWTFSAFVRDISDRKRSEDQLRASELSLRTMIETIPGMLWSATPDGAVDYCNARVLDYTGLPQEQIKGDGWLKTVHPDDADRMARAWALCVENGDYFQFEFRCLRASDGMYRWCVSRALPLRAPGGRILKWYGTVVDFHDRRKAEEDLRNTQAELAHVNRVMTMGALTASIAHEVSQPLAAIIASCDSCTAWLASDPPNLDKARAATSRMIKAATQASEIVQRVRALFKKTPSITAPVDVNELLEETISFVRHEAQRQNVSLRADLGAGLPTVGGDRVQLEQVILNLMMNGIESMAGLDSEPKQILVRSALPNPGELLVSVADTGPGIDAEHANGLFAPFFTTKPQGIGMGLPICRSIIEAHGGRLWAENNVSGGAVFQFILPTKAINQ
jgi:PAS domain S-box-containing protein